MQIISSKASVAEVLNLVLAVYNTRGKRPFISSLHSELLLKKVKFPLLEYAATRLIEVIPEEQLLSTADEIIKLREIGSNVLAGIILRDLSERNLSKAFDKALEYMIYGDEWYCCDIISERVMGYALLGQPEETIPMLRDLAQDERKWACRYVGVATHYAVKKGLKKKYVEEMFRILLSTGKTTEFHAKTGIGWGAKTVAKFHPEIVARYSEQIAQETAKWFQTKIKIGLSRNYKYADRYKD